MTAFHLLSNQAAAPTERVAAAEVASVGQEMADLSLWGMFLQADLVVKAVMVGLLLASFWCWAVIFEKIARFSDLKKRAARFEQDFWSAETLESYYDHVKRHSRHPFAVVFMAAIEEWFRTGKDARNSGALAPSAIDRIAKVMGVARNRELEKLERGLGFLASIGSAAPFIGLFGTVWGIMNSFQSIAYSNNTSLAVVAPGIAEALLATAIGLFAAIPAVIAYNRFSSELANYAGDLEDFETEFLALLSRQTEKARA